MKPPPDDDPWLALTMLEGRLAPLSSQERYDLEEAVLERTLPKASSASVSRRHRRWVYAASLTAAAAASVALFRPSLSERPAPSDEVIPDYRLEAPASDAWQRSAPGFQVERGAEVRRYSSTRTLEVLLRAEKAHSAPMAVDCFVVAREGGGLGAIHHCPGVIRTAPEGNVRLTIPLRELNTPDLSGSTVASTGVRITAFVRRAEDPPITDARSTRHDAQRFDLDFELLAPINPVPPLSNHD